MKKSQTEKILELFKPRKWVRVQELHNVAWRYGALLHNLKKEGYIFEKRRQRLFHKLEEWRLIIKPKL